MKLYVDLGNVLTGTPFGANLYSYVEKAVEPLFLGPSLDLVRCDVHAGRYAQGKLQLDIAGGQQTAQLTFGGQTSVAGEIIAGYEESFGPSGASATIAGAAGSGSDR